MFRLQLIFVDGAVCGTIVRFLCSLWKVAEKYFNSFIEILIGEFEWGVDRKPDFFITSEFWRYRGVRGIGRNSRNTVENEGWDYEQVGLTPKVQGEVGDERVQILNVREYDRFIAGHIHPIKLGLVLHVKKSFR